MKEALQLLESQKRALSIVLPERNAGVKSKLSLADIDVEAFAREIWLVCVGGTLERFNGVGFSSLIEYELFRSIAPSEFHVKRTSLTIFSQQYCVETSLE